jgi:hypothetical protein
MECIPIQYPIRLKKVYLSGSDHVEGASRTTCTASYDLGAEKLN